MSRLLLAAGCALLAAFSSAHARPARPLETAPALATHPLDPLTKREFAALKVILREQGHFNDKTLYGWAQLQEPPKDEVLAFHPGQPFRREALVVAICPDRKTSFEVVVDLRARKILSSRDLGNQQTFLTNPEYKKAQDAAEASQEVRAALEKRGYKLGRKISDTFYIDCYAPGDDPLTIKDGHTIRAIRLLFSDRQGGRNNYGVYADGLMAMVDLEAGKVIAVQETGGASIQRKVPHDVYSRAVLGARESSAALRITAAARDLRLDGSHARWGHWDFRFSFNQREGLVLHQIAYDDTGKLRSICYRASISEMLVPYSDPSRAWVWREFLDVGEYGLGTNSTPVQAGREVPSNALTLAATLPDTALAPSADFPSNVFLFERDGGALFAHQQEGNAGVYGRGKELVIGFIATVGNYDYLYKWVFRQDGTFGFETDLHGIILSRTVDDTACALCANQAEQGPGTYMAEGAQRFGTIVTPQLLGVYHQHWINLRMDFDVDGPVNAVKECNTKPLPPDPEENAKGRAFTVEHTIFGKESEAERNIDLGSNRSWVIYNPAVKSLLGHPAGFEVDPAGNTASAIPEARFGEVGSFSQRHFWVTQYDPAQLYATGRYPNQARAGDKDSLYTYAKDDQSIYKQDVVVWYSLGYTHITKPEDYPIMPAGHVAVNFSPKAFFQKSPALGYAK